MVAIKNEVKRALGQVRLGNLCTTRTCRISAQPMRINLARFASDDCREASREEKARAWSDYFGYCGTYSVDEEAKAVIHHIEGSWFPNLVD
jgi:Lipocalin-like domain